MTVRQVVASGRLAGSQHPGVLATAMLGLLLLTFALSVDFPKAAFGFQSDSSTYYSLGHSLARDCDFTFERRDLERVWKEFPTGPEGIFLKKGKTIAIRPSRTFPFLEWVKGEDPRDDRLYYGKSFAYPLAAAPFVFLFGTNGFLVLHAILLTACFAAVFAFAHARSRTGPALCWAFAFLFASAAPVYFVWLTPEMFNLAMMLLGLFLWAYKEVASPAGPSANERAGIGQAHAEAVAEPAPALSNSTTRSRLTAFLHSPASDLGAAVLLGIATFSKPLNIVAIGPVLLLYLWRRQWRRGILTLVVFVAVVAGFFTWNAAITGEFNYQGGDRNTFYGGTGFPFLTPEAKFSNTGLVRSTNAVPADVLFTRDALLRVLPANLVYFVFGRHTGLLPYFFPGMLALGLFALARGRRQAFQWCALAGLVVGSLGLLVYMPFTYSGGGGPIGNRYFMGFYALFLLLTPPLRTAAPALVAMGIGGLFTSQLVLNPFYVSFHPGEHTKTGAFRWLPIELSLVNDLPVNVTPTRARQPLGGEPPIIAYFIDDGAFAREGEWFWVRGESRADLILRAPARQSKDGSWESLRVRHFTVEVRSGAVPNVVTISTGADRARIALEAESSGALTVRAGAGLPYKAVGDLPTNYIYRMSIRSQSGFVPMFSGGGDSRYLGAMVHIVPVYERP